MKNIILICVLSFNIQSFADKYMAWENTVDLFYKNMPSKTLKKKDIIEGETNKKYPDFLNIKIGKRMYTARKRYFITLDAYLKKIQKKITAYKPQKNVLEAEIEQRRNELFSHFVNLGEAERDLTIFVSQISSNLQGNVFQNVFRKKEKSPLKRLIKHLKKTTTEFEKNLTEANKRKEKHTVSMLKMILEKNAVTLRFEKNKEEKKNIYIVTTSDINLYKKGKIALNLKRNHIVRAIPSKKDRNILLIRYKGEKYRSNSQGFTSLPIFEKKLNYFILRSDLKKDVIDGKIKIIDFRFKLYEGLKTQYSYEKRYDDQFAYLHHPQVILNKNHTLIIESTPNTTADLILIKQSERQIQAWNKIADKLMQDKAQLQNLKKSINNKVIEKKELIQKINNDI